MASQIEMCGWDESEKMLKEGKMLKVSIIH